MNAQQTTEAVTLMPAAVTRWATSLVPVYLDTPEMDSPAQVNQKVHIGHDVSGQHQQDVRS